LNLADRRVQLIQDNIGIVAETCESYLTLVLVPFCDAFPVIKNKINYDIVRVKEKREKYIQIQSSLNILYASSN
jgi:hypothetical protein